LCSRMESSAFTFSRELHPLSGGSSMRWSRLFSFVSKAAVSLLTGVMLLAAQAKPENTKPEEPKPSNVVLQPDGTIELPSESVPLSKFLSPEGKAYLNQHLHDMQNPEILTADKGVPRFMVPYLERQKALYALQVDDQKIAGVHALVYVP